MTSFFDMSYFLTNLKDTIFLSNNFKIQQKRILEENQVAWGSFLRSPVQTTSEILTNPYHAKTPFEAKKLIQRTDNGKKQTCFSLLAKYLHEKLCVFWCYLLERAFRY